MIRGWIDRLFRCWLTRRACDIDVQQIATRNENEMPHRVQTQWRCSTCGRVWEREWNRWKGNK